MTVIEMQTMEALKSACRKFESKCEKIDWEQRIYEVSAGIIMRHPEMDAEDAISIANCLISKLRES